MLYWEENDLISGAAFFASDGFFCWAMLFNQRPFCP